MRIKSLRVSDEDALAIYSDPRPYKEIAADYGVHYTVVSGIKYGDTHAAVTGGKKIKTRRYRKLSTEEVQAIYTAAGSYSSIALQFGAAVSTVNAIKAGTLRRKETKGLKRGKHGRE